MANVGRSTEDRDTKKPKEKLQQQQWHKNVFLLSGAATGQGPEVEETVSLEPWSSPEQHTGYIQRICPAQIL